MTVMVTSQAVGTLPATSMTHSYEQLAPLKTLDESQNRLWRLFLTAYANTMERIEQDLEDAGLPNSSWYDVLWTLEKAPGHEMRLHELAQAVLLSRSNITRLIDRLEEAGLLCRKRCPKDRRGAYAALTPAGLALRQTMWTTYAHSIAQYFTDHLQPDEVAILTQALDRIVTHQSNRKYPQKEN